MKFGYFCNTTNWTHKPYHQLLDETKEITEYCDQNKWNSIWFTEHHFNHEGMESCTNPLMMGADAAARTKNIRIGQAANVITFHNPIRLAEDIATLDQLSKGRVEVGVARGIYGREAINLNKEADRKMVVIDPVKLTITNYPEGKTEKLESEDNPEKDSIKKRIIPFNKHLYIEREDFKEEANRKFFRLTTGKEVRLKSAYIIKGTGVIKDAAGNIVEILCEYDPKSKSGSGTEESLRKVKGTLHWVTQKESINIIVNSYDRLFKEEAPGSNEKGNFLDDINPNSLKVVHAKAEPSLKDVVPGETFQFQRKGYFTVDKKSKADNIVFNKTVGLRDSWKK